MPIKIKALFSKLTTKLSIVLIAISPFEAQYHIVKNFVGPAHYSYLLLIIGIVFLLASLENI